MKTLQFSSVQFSSVQFRPSCASKGSLLCKKQTMKKNLQGSLHVNNPRSEEGKQQQQQQQQ